MSYGFSVVVVFALVVAFALVPVVVVFGDVVVLVLVAVVAHEAAAVVVVAAIGFDGDGSSEISISDFERDCLSATQTPNRRRRRKL